MWLPNGIVVIQTLLMLLTEMLSAIISSLIDAAMHVAFYSKQVAVIDLLTDDPRNDLNAGMRLIKELRIP